ncbi:DNA lyase [Stutzerimonas stutzeri]|uniref:DNA lyase n=1 Tax=Stutzerimonas stutzeri TaxID=316 RepID=A0A2N8T6U2_STUST|nr:pyrimidine dimer DNA glycosylase/endonuclease V [Stutzerimonas stutzeri]MCQ4323516.1 pyrimidine dimer DNA glycosylase/endonuclease V [Stutzerimonas stutzeri]PNG10497.1 DNA lyase [Stutzerimonas stutzeri]
MRLWSLHPRYLDAKGLVALWREGLLAQAVLCGQTRGYRRHPQLRRFAQCVEPAAQVAGYLQAVHAEALRRGYRFDAQKIGIAARLEPMSVSRGQLEYERTHLMAKLAVRQPALLDALQAEDCPLPHPLFQLVEGPVEPWEVLSGG